jgi:hypothetical protein
MMLSRLKGLVTVVFLGALLTQAAIVDRIAIIAGNTIIKDSDILRDLRVTAFLNNESPAISPASRKIAADRLLDQALIRKEIEAGEYPSAPVAEAQSLLADVKKRYLNDAAYQRALAARGIDEEELKARLLWQLTVLSFIDMRFRPAAIVTDEETEKYYNEHRQQMQASNPGKPATLDAFRPQIQDTLAGERVNGMLEEWLIQRRKETRIVCLEDALK